MNEITITAPDDFHVHLRDGFMLPETVPATARTFRRGIIMPNLVPPVVNAQMVSDYRERITKQIPAGAQFEPLMTLYLTNDTTAEDIREAREMGVVAAKLYPAGATTNSDAAVSALKDLYPIFTAMAEVGMVLCIHGEVTDSEIDVFDREATFIERYLRGIVEEFPQLKIVMEHITTADAAEFVLNGPDNLAATITPQHLLLNRNDLLVGGVRPHNFCLPILKRNTHQKALQDVVKSGSKKFFLGTDSAPHEKHRKESACGCAGCYSAWSAIELYAQVFEEIGALDKLEAFASHNGADFYGLPRNEGTITLKRQSWTVPELLTLPTGEKLVPFHAGLDLNWKFDA